MSVHATRTHDAVEADELLASGGRLRRLAHDMEVVLELARPATPDVAEGISLEPIAMDPTAIAAAASAATPPDHADYMVWSGVDRVKYWEELLAGEGPCGSVLAVPSQVARGADGCIVGAVVVAAMPASEWWAGAPWIPEVFVIPEFQGRGLGGALLAHAMRACAVAGDKRLGLTVTHGNPAQRLYERVGFRTFRSTWFIELSGVDETTRGNALRP